MNIELTLTLNYRAELSAHAHVDQFDIRISVRIEKQLDSFRQAVEEVAVDTYMKKANSLTPNFESERGMTYT